MLVLELVEAVERVVVELPTNVSVAVQLLSVGVGRLETVLVGVVHGSLLALVLDVLFQHIQRHLPRRDEAIRAVPERIAPQFGLQFIFVLVADATGGRTLHSVDELHEVRGWLCSKQDVNVVVLAVEVGQFDAVLVREPADDPVDELGSLLGQHSAPILRSEYQVVVQGIHRVRPRVEVAPLGSSHTTAPQRKSIATTWGCGPTPVSLYEQMMTALYPHPAPLHSVAP